MTLHSFYAWRANNLGDSAAIAYLLLFVTVVLCVSFFNLRRPQAIEAGMITQDIRMSPRAKALRRRWFEPKSIKEMAPATAVIVYGLLILWAVFVLFPLYWLLITSFKLPADVNAGPVYLPWIDFTPSLHAWRELFVFDYRGHAEGLRQLDHHRAFRHALCVTIGSMAAYALARIQYKPKFGAIVLFVLCIWRRRSWSAVGASIGVCHWPSR